MVGCSYNHKKRRTLLCALGSLTNIGEANSMLFTLYIGLQYTIYLTVLCLMQELKRSSNAGSSVSAKPLQFVPSIRSGSFADIGPRRYMEDEHIRIDDLSGHLGSLLMFSAPSAFYGVCAVTMVQVIIIVQCKFLNPILTVCNFVFRSLMAMGVQMQLPT
jgi:hypothetical protein